jgi:hypothetical protein
LLIKAFSLLPLCCPLCFGSRTMSANDVVLSKTENTDDHGKRAVLNVAPDPSRIAAASSAISVLKNKPLPYTAPS